MIYGLYLSAAGVMANGHRQDVIANNLANAETDGFKRALAPFQERPPERVVAPMAPGGDPRLSAIGGGQLVSPTAFDYSQGGLERTANPLDAAVVGRGFFAVADGPNGEPALTRDGSFQIDRDGWLVSTNDVSQKVLGPDRRPINLAGRASGNLRIDDGGAILDRGLPVARLGTFDVPDPAVLTPRGAGRYVPPDPALVAPAPALVRGGFVERSNVDPAVELTRLIDAQRQLEANATLIKLQDQTLGRLVNEAMKVGP